MGSGSSVDSSDREEYADEIVAAIGFPDGTDTDAFKAQCGWVREAAENAEAGPIGFPCSNPKCTGKSWEDTDDDELCKAEAVHKWKIAGYLNGAALAAKHMSKIFQFYQMMGPIVHPKNGTQVTRKSLTALLTEAGKLPPKHVTGVVNMLMMHIGKETKQSGFPKSRMMTYKEKEMNGEDFYGMYVKQLVVVESSNGAANWCDTNWVIKDKSKCPGAAAIKADLDKLGTTGEFGINQHENRLYWFENFMNQGEEKTLALLTKYTKWIGGEVADDEEY
jgi:hypothetical protein